MIKISRVPFARRPAFLANGIEIDVVRIAQSLRICTLTAQLLLGDIADRGQPVPSYYAAYRELSARSAQERRDAA